MENYTKFPPAASLRYMVPGEKVVYVNPSSNRGFPSFAKSLFANHSESTVMNAPKAPISFLLFFLPRISALSTRFILLSILLS